jgi:hypothetical protein
VEVVEVLVGVEVFAAVEVVEVLVVVSRNARCQNHKNVGVRQTALLEFNEADVRDGSTEATTKNIRENSVKFETKHAVQNIRPISGSLPRVKSSGYLRPVRVSSDSDEQINVPHLSGCHRVLIELVQEARRPNVARRKYGSLAHVARVSIVCK